MNQRQERRSLRVEIYANMHDDDMFHKANVILLGNTKGS